MRVTTRTNLAIRALMVCAVNPGRTVRKHDIATSCNASENHLAQVVNMLAQLSLVETQRGRAGGMRLARPPEEICIGTVFRSFEAGIPFAECFDDGANTCPLAPACRLRIALEDALSAFHTELDKVTLADLVRDNAELTQILCLSQPATRLSCPHPGTPGPAANGPENQQTG